MGPIFLRWTMFLRRESLMSTASVKAQTHARVLKDGAQRHTLQPAQVGIRVWRCGRQETTLISRSSTQIHSRCDMVARVHDACPANNMQKYLL